MMLYCQCCSTATLVQLSATPALNRFMLISAVLARPCQPCMLSLHNHSEKWSLFRGVSGNILAHLEGI